MYNTVIRQKQVCRKTIGAPHKRRLYDMEVYMLDNINWGLVIPIAIGVIVLLLIIITGYIKAPPGHRVHHLGSQEKNNHR